MRWQSSYGLWTVFATLVVFVLLATPAKAACFFPDPIVERSDLGPVCGSNGFVTGQIATPGSKIIGGVLQDQMNDLVLAREPQTPAGGGPIMLSLAPSTSIPALRALAPVEVVPFSLAQADDLPPAAADPGRLGRVGEADFGLYLTGFVTDESQDRTSREAGSDTTRLGFSIGVQIVRPDWLAGIGFDFTDEDTDYDRFRFRALSRPGNGEILPEEVVNVGRTRQSSKEYGLQVFGLRFFGDSFLQAAGRVAFIDHEIRRPNQIIMNEFPVRRDVAEGDTDGYRLGAFLGGGRIFNLTSTTALLLGAGLDVEYMRTDGYSEELAGSGGETRAQGLLRFEDDDSVSVQSVLEARVTQRVALGNVILLPTLAGRYFHEFANDARDIDFSFLSFPGGTDDLARTNDSFRTNSPDRNFFHVEVGLGIPIGERLFFDIAATKLLGHSFRDEESISAGIRLAF